MDLHAVLGAGERISLFSGVCMAVQRRCSSFLPTVHASPPLSMQLSGGHKYLPPRQDINAPDLYIPVMALWTYCILVGVALFGGQAFRPELVYNTVSSAVGAWAVHTFVLKLVLWVLGLSSSAPLLELAAYAGYPFVAACAVLLARLALGAFLISCLSGAADRILLILLLLLTPAFHSPTLPWRRRRWVPRGVGILQLCDGHLSGEDAKARHFSGNAPLR